MAKTTEAHFGVYKKAIRHYLDKYNVTGWHIYFSHCDDYSGYASTYATLRTRAVNFTLTIEWDSGGLDLTDKAVRRMAKHEVIHLMQWPVYAMAGERYVSQIEVDTAHEEIVTQLTDLLPD